jgi:hypothetical protein
MEIMTVLATIWGVLTAALVVLLIYRSMLGMHEDDQLFLDPAGSQMEGEQKELMVKMKNLRPYVLALSASSGLLVLVMAGIWVVRAWNRF